MKTGLSLLRLEARRRIAFLIALYFAGLTVYVSLGEMPVGVWIWPYTSVALQSSLVLTGPLAAGLGAWSAARSRRHNLEELLAATPLPTAARDFATCASMALWLVSGYSVATLCLLSSTLLKATWGIPNVAPLIAGLVAIIMWSTVGYAFGYFLPRMLTAVFVTVLAYLIQGIAGFFLESYLSPVGIAVPDVFSGLWSRIPVVQSVFFAGITVLTFWIVVVKSLRSSALLWIILAAAIFATFVSAIVLIRADHTKATTGAVAYDPVCEERREITVCLHPAYASLLPEVANIANRMIEPLGDASEVPVRAVQIPTQPAVLTPDGTLKFFLYDERTLDYLPSELVVALVQSHESYEAGDALTKTQTVIAASLLKNSGVSDPQNYLPGLLDEDTSDAAEHFDGLSAAERRAWLEDNYAGVRTDDVDLKGLP